MDSTGRKDRMERYLEAGTLFDEKYRIQGVLGSGSFALVVHAMHEAMERDVALKFLRPELVEADPTVSERFVNEVRIVSRLTSPHTVKVYDFGKTPEGIHYMVLEHVEGQSLDLILERHGAIKARQAVKLCLQLLESLEEAHRLGVIHRDLKPANLMLGQIQGKKNQLKVLDFGVAKLLEAAPQTPLETPTLRRGAPSHERRSTQLVGTPTYMSPEQIIGQPVSAASDLYSVGLILYEMLRGRTAIEERNVTNVARIHLDESPIPFAEIDQVPPVLAAIILKATARQMGDRYESAREMSEALETAVSGQAASGQARSGAQPGRGESPAPARDSKMEVADISDVFLGRSYIAAPETPGIPLRKPSPLPALSKKKPSQSEPLFTRPKPNRALELNEEVKVRDRTRPSSAKGREVTVDDLRRRSQGQATRHNSLLGTLSFVGLVLGTYLAFVVASAPLGEQGSALRTIVGFLPLGAAIVWTGFAAVPIHHAGWLRRWLLPTARNVGAILGLLLFLYALMGHRMAAHAFAEESAWFFRHLPDHGLLHVFESMTRRFGEVLSGMYAVIGRHLPW